MEEKAHQEADQQVGHFRHQAFQEARHGMALARQLLQVPQLLFGQRRIAGTEKICIKNC